MNRDPPGAVRDGGAIMWMFEIGGVAFSVLNGLSLGFAGGRCVIVKIAVLTPLLTVIGPIEQPPMHEIVPVPVQEAE